MSEGEETDAFLLYGRIRFTFFQDHLIKDVVAAHETQVALAEAMNTAGFWEQTLDEIVEKMCALAGIKPTVAEEKEEESSEDEEESGETRRCFSVNRN